MNWDNARIFLAVARTGTLRGAAQRLAVDQATVGRRVAALEDELSAKLFLRTSTALVLTPAGEALIGPAEAMEQAAHTIERRIAGTDEQLAGTIRVATTETLAATFVLPAIAQLRQQHPGIDIVCMTSKSIANLTKREADVAVRTLRPDAPDLIARRIAQLETGIYASRSYVAARGMPEEGTAFAGHDLVLYPRNEVPWMWEDLCGEPISRGRVVLQSSSAMTVFEAIVAGIGITELVCHRAETRPELVRVLPNRRDTQDVWLVTHADLHKTARVRALMDAIVNVFCAYKKPAMPQRAQTA
ncbi:LysR family transcriptional regulator [Ralstonia insidiosa]|uniref:LysR family transcriptional regulator n=1 Tax=Ralstonia insidiosa TaxID=190721 RepID=A0A192A207_9RALS|nr:LysR family transcriptional regulator [Ralstonia insidiosa]ANJ74500.1 LysR family transcriptional regulator [Ralstonia insidiosa]MBY4911277.1 LysR family transcriptional regulator [Ralstonia insidiosa]